MSDSARRHRFVLGAICAVLVAVPFLVVRYSPITDLAQQVAQIRLFDDALRHPGETYVIQWFTPYSLSYVLLGFTWWLFSPLAAGRVAMLLLGVSWVAAVHVLAAKRGRPAESAVLASLFFFSHVTYWGLYSFSVGFPVFVLWFILLSRGANVRLSTLFAVAGLALLLYTSHALWFVVGMAWLVIADVLARSPFSARLAHLATVFPVALGATVWYLSSFAGRSSELPKWDSFDRLTFDWLVDGAFGGLRGPMEALVLASVLIWLIVSFFHHGRNFWRLVDRELLLAAGVFFLIAFIAPDRFMNTRNFSARWIPPAMAFLIVSVPAPRLAPMLRSSCALALVVALTWRTVASWRSVEEEELSGLGAALDALPEAPKLLGLDFVMTSQFVKNRAFLQTAAYAQVLKGGTLNFSFAEAAASLVVFRRDRPTPPWTHWLEWRANWVKPRDFLFFDYALINGSEQAHLRYSRAMPVRPVTREGRWRLYQVVHP